MNFVRKYAKVLLWGGVITLGLGGIGAICSGDFISGVLLIVVAVALLPVSSIQNFWKMLPEKFKWVKGVGLSALFLIGMCFASPATETPEKAKPETAEQAIVMTENKDKNDGKSDTEASETAPGTTTQKAPTTTAKAPTTTTKVPATTTKAPTTTAQPPSAQIVYITATGEKYHSSKNCSGLSRAKAIYDSTLSAAQQKGLGPCSECH